MGIFRVVVLLLAGMFIGYDIGTLIVNLIPTPWSWVVAGLLLGLIICWDLLWGLVWKWRRNRSYKKWLEDGGRDLVSDVRDTD